MMSTQEEVGEKMNSSSKTMVQAVTLLTALRMFANGKITVIMTTMMVMNMKSSSKTMVQAVTLLAVFGMFANSKIMIRILVIRGGVKKTVFFYF